MFCELVGFGICAFVSTDVTFHLWPTRTLAVPLSVICCCPHSDRNRWWFSDEIFRFIL